MIRTPCYELRTYICHPGKRDALNTRFRTHTLSIFKRCGIDVVGFWVPTEGTDTLVYLLRFPDRAARERSWQAFGKDPEWPVAVRESEANGPLVVRVESVLLETVNFSPKWPRRRGRAPRLFELRTYTATPGNRERLLERFRNHTIDLLDKHGIQSGLYFVPLPDQPRAADTLIYFVVHRDADARGKSFAAFSADPVWQAARTDSEKAAGGPLTVPNGVVSLLLTPTDYSPLR
jgi:NIPSNAP